MPADPRTILITGATGLVGGLLLRRLALHTPGCLIYALARTRPAATDLPQTQFLTGDITHPQLGLDDASYLHLCNSLDTIVHCAASTSFTLPLPAARQVNVCGTANILKLARRAPRLRMLLHTSSTHVAGRRPGALPEAPVHNIDSWFSSYEQSKYEAEQLIVEQGEGLPWTIARLSTLVGDSRTGHVSQVNYFHQLLGLVPRNPFPIIPGAGDALVDVVADDWVTEALHAILLQEVAPARVLHLCAGPAQSLPAQDLLRLAFEIHRRTDPRSHSCMPWFVSVAEFRAYAAGLRRRGQETLWRLSEILQLSLPHLEAHQAFLNAATNESLARSGVMPLRTRDFLPLIIQRCFDGSLAPATS